MSVFSIAPCDHTASNVCLHTQHVFAQQVKHALSTHAYNSHLLSREQTCYQVYFTMDTLVPSTGGVHLIVAQEQTKKRKFGNDEHEMNADKNNADEIDAGNTDSAIAFQLLDKWSWGNMSAI